MIRSPVIIPELPRSSVDENPLASGNLTSREVEVRRDPEEEYFMLAILAHKMIHTEDFDGDYVYEING